MPSNMLDSNFDERDTNHAKKQNKYKKDNILEREKAQSIKADNTSQTKLKKDSTASDTRAEKLDKKKSEINNGDKSPKILKDKSSSSKSLSDRERSSRLQECNQNDIPAKLEYHSRAQLPYFLGNLSEDTEDKGQNDKSIEDKQPEKKSVDKKKSEERQQEKRSEDKSVTNTISEQIVIGHNIRKCKLIGQGAYGKVYHSVDEFQTVIAVKEIPNDEDTGISCLMEASIMSTLHHPLLHSSIQCLSTDKSLFIISEIAISDLSKYVKKDGNLPGPDLLRYWSHSLVQAVAFLHRSDIIHCDIKASNILLFHNDIIKLADFTIATKKYNDKTVIRDRSICTVTHRPFEVWLQRIWDTPVDIWSLGCTLYEIAVGELLFPVQPNYLSEQRNDRDRYLNAILDWGAIWGYNNDRIDKKEINYHEPNLHHTFFSHYNIKNTIKSKQRDDSKNTSILPQKFTDFVLSMLKVEPGMRPTASQLLDNPYFKSDSSSGVSEQSSASKSRNEQISKKLVRYPYRILTTSSATFTEAELQKITRNLMRHTSSSAVIQLSTELYSRTTGIRFENKQKKLYACLWIASKMIFGEPIRADISLSELLILERTICTHLSFRLHFS